MPLLFSYGTLRDPAVQRANFGRELTGRPDHLPGYAERMLEITDPDVVRVSGQTHHPIVVATGDAADAVPGTVFEVTDDELVAADGYEVDDYRRVLVSLASGVRAWVYVGPATGYHLSEDPADLDLDRVVGWISTDAYWAKGRTRELIERAFANSIPAGLYTADRQQVAVARIVSDLATFAWLCDVYVDPDHRGRGLGTLLGSWSVEWAERIGIKRILLATLNAHGVYAKAGFVPVAHPERWMEIDTRPPFA